MRASTVAFICAVAFASSGTAAYATATVGVHNEDGSSQTYSNVSVKIVNQALNLTTSDGKGTLIIKKAACSYAGEIQVCLPYTLTIVQSGASHALDFERGTVYLNLSDSVQTLPQSSMQIPVRGIVMSLKTKIGTIINMTGTIDQVTK